MNTPKTICIDNVEYVRKDSVVTYTPRKEGVWEIGKSYVFRTVTMINHGRLVDVTPNEFVLINAAWIPDTGRWSQFINGSITPNEIEPYPVDKLGIVSRCSLVDACELDKEFLEQK
jgi:hypothetical protein